jgi:hypothetical protein
VNAVSGITHDIIINKVNLTLTGNIPLAVKNDPVNVDLTALTDTAGNALTGTLVIGYLSNGLPVVLSE